MGDIMERENNLLKKNIVKQSYKIVSLFIMFLSASALWYYNISPYWENGYTGYLTLALVGIMFCIIYWFFAKMYQALKIGIYRLTELMYFQVLAIVLADAALLFESIMWFHGFQKLKIWSYFLGMVFQVVAMGGNIFVHNRLFALYDERRKILIVYGNDGYKTLIKKMQSKKYRYEIVGCYSDETSLEVLEDNIGKAEGIYLYEVDDQLKRKLVLFCDSISKDIYLTQSVEDLLTMGFDVSHTFDTPFIRTKRMPEKWYYAFIKRTIDILFSSMGLIILSPMLLIVAACIKLYDGGPVFYKQIRLTKGHKEFEIYYSF